MKRTELSTTRHTVRKYSLIGLLGILACMKIGLANKGITTTFHHLTKFAKGQPTVVTNAKSYLRLYLVMNFIDSIKAVALKEHYTSHVHHVASGGEFGIGTLRGPLTFLLL